MAERSLRRGLYGLALLLLGGSCSTGGTTGGASAAGGQTALPTAAGGKSAADGGRPQSGGAGADPTGGRPQASGGDSAAGGSKIQGDGGGQGSSGGAGGAGGNSMAPSAGCERTGAGESGRFAIDVAGTSREYILSLPSDYDPKHPYRIIFGWHGRMYDAEWVANGEPPLTGPYFGIEAEANGEAIFVAPQALSTGWSNEDGRDIAFVRAMLSQLESELCIDRRRIFSTGFSFGAMLTMSIGCEMADVFRAIAPMSGSLGNGCPAPGRPIAYFATHGLSDTTIRPEQGEAARDEFRERNHCGASSRETDRAGCIEFEECDEGYPVVWCAFDGAHEPPPFAGVALWEFLSKL